MSFSAPRPRGLRFSRFFCLRTLASRLGGLLLCCVSAPALAGIPIQHWMLPGGAKVYLVESHGLPMVDVQIDFDAGSRRDPPDKVGLASVTAAIASRGIAGGAGGPALDENQLGQAWADLGASFNIGVGTDRMSFSLRSLSYPQLLPQAAQLAARQLADPAFAAELWQRERERYAASLREANTRPATLASRAYAAAVYGDHPYGREVTEQSLGRISVADMQGFYRQMIQPCRARLSIVGAVTRAQAQVLADTLLSGLAQQAPDAAGGGAGGQAGQSGAAACAPLQPVPEVAPLAEAIEQVIPFDSAQAHVLIGQPGFRRDDPDYFALTVGNYILGGGGFVSRLATEVREKRGLSYSVYSYFSPGLHAGAFTLGLQTRPDQAAQAVAVVREVVARFVADGPSEAELRAAKDFMAGGFALRIDSNRKLLDQISAIAWNNLPLDELDRYTHQVEKVTLADIRAAFARKLQPQRMVTVIVGATGTR